MCESVQQKLGHTKLGVCNNMRYTVTKIRNSKVDENNLVHIFEVMTNASALSEK